MATTEPVQREASPARELAVAIIGAVCGAVVTYLFNWTDATKVIGIALGAGIPPFVTTGASAESSRPWIRTSA